MEKNRFQLAIVLVCFFLVLASACQFRAAPETIPPTLTPTQRAPTPDVEGVYLPFETIEKSEGGWGNLNEYFDKGPWMEVLTQSSSAEQLQYPVSKQAMSVISQNDFEEHIVIAVFQGWQGSLDYAVDIVAVTQVKNRILVYASFIEPDPELEVAAQETLPYQLIKIRREGLNGKLVFELIVEDDVIQQIEAILQ